MHETNNNEEDQVLAPPQAKPRVWKRVSTQVDEEQWKKVKRVAIDDDREIREVLHDALEQYLGSRGL